MLTRNPYYYLFYVMASFLKWLNKGYKDYAFRAVAVVTMLMGANLLSLAFLLIDFHYSKTTVNLICLFLTALLLIINYHFLYRNGKAKAILEIFESTDQGGRPEGWKLVAAIGYSVLSLVVFFYLAYLGSLHKLPPAIGSKSA